MVIKVYKNWMNRWEPIRQEWDKNREILCRLAVSGNIAFKKLEHITAYFKEHGITAIEDKASLEDTDVPEQLMLF